MPLRETDWLEKNINKVKIIDCSWHMPQTNRDGFKEAIKDKGSGEVKRFFNLGPNNKWEKILDSEIKDEIEKKFNVEMKELGYL